MQEQFFLSSFEQFVKVLQKSSSASERAWSFSFITKTLLTLSRSDFFSKCFIVMFCTNLIIRQT